MRGLLRNNVYSMGQNFQISILISLTLMIIPFFMGEEALRSIMSMQILMFIVNIGSSLATDVNSRWDRFEITLPLKRSDIIKARYFLFLALIGVGLVVGLVTLFIFTIVREPVSANVVFASFAYGISLSIMTSSLMYPTMLIFGTDKNELIIVVCALVSVTVNLTIAALVSPMTNDNLMVGEKIFPNAVNLVVSLVVFLISFLLSVSIYKKKEL